MSNMKVVGIGHGSKIGHKMEPAIAAILSHSSIEAAAKAVGVTASTLLRWMKDPKFDEMLKAARRRMFDGAIGTLQNAATDAANTIIGIMNDKKAPLASRLNAAQMILQHSKKAFRVEDIDELVEKLERKVAGRTR